VANKKPKSMSRLIDKMSEAIALGKPLIERDREFDDMFATYTITK